MRGNKNNTRSVDIYAKSVFREMKTNGYTRDQIVAFASEVLELLTEEVRLEPGEEATEAAETAA